jgi:hypothetical protein
MIHACNLSNQHLRQEDSESDLHSETLSMIKTAFRILKCLKCLRLELNSFILKITKLNLKSIGENSASTLWKHFKI